MTDATQENRGTTDGEFAEESPSDAVNTPENAGAAPAQPSEWAELSSLDVGDEVMVDRKSPEYAIGYLGSISLGGNGPAEVLEKIRVAHGGGIFVLTPRKRAANGRRLFSGGSIRVQIAGNPIVDGVRTGPNGPIVESAPPQHASPPPYYGAQPVGWAPAPAQESGMQSELMGLVGQALRKGDASIDLAGVIGALNQLNVSNAPEQSQRIDGFAEVRKALELTNMLRESAGNSEAPAPEPSSGRMDKLFEMLAMKFMAGDSAPTPRPRPVPQPQSQQSPVNGPATAQPTANHVWHPGKGWILWGEAAPEASSQAPTGSEPTPSAPDGAGPAPTSPDNDYVDPIQPDEFIGELESKSPEERVAFMQAVLSMVGDRPELEAAFMGALPGGDSEAAVE